MAEIMEQQLQNLYTVYYQKYDGALLYHDGLYDVRRPTLPRAANAKRIKW